MFRVFSYSELQESKKGPTAIPLKAIPMGGQAETRLGTGDFLYQSTAISVACLLVKDRIGIIQIIIYLTYLAISREPA